MKFHITATSLVAAVCLVMHIGNARILTESQSYPDKRNVSHPFLIYVPDNFPSLTPPEEFQTTKNSGTTTVEIIRSVEVNLNGFDDSNIRRPSSDTGDLLFSDIDSNGGERETSGKRGARNNEHNRPKLSDLLSLTPSETKNEYQGSHGKSSSKRLLTKTLSADGLDFNSRILLGTTLIRNFNHEMQDDKYSYFSDPTVSDNVNHATYVNRNSSTALNTSRINVKFPPKMFPLVNSNTQRNRANKTSVIKNKISQTQKALYHSRIGKQTNIKQNNTQTRNTETYDKQEPSEVTQNARSQTQNKTENPQALTHWDFGKKTAHNHNNEEGYILTSGLSTTPSTMQNEHVLAQDSPHIIHPTKSTLLRLEEPTPTSGTENEITRTAVPRVIFRGAYPQQQSIPIYNNINSIQTLPFLSSLNNFKSPQHYHTTHAHNRNEIRTNHLPRLFPNTHVQDNTIINHVRGGNAEDAKTRTYISETMGQNYIPVANVRQQSERQNGERNNWLPVYFVPHTALQQHNQPTVINLRTVNTVGAVSPLPIILEQQNSHLYRSALVRPNHADPTPNGIIYEGVLVTYPQHIQDESSDIIPVLIV